MNRAALTSLMLLLVAAPLSAEVSVTRESDGTARLFFATGPDGPWDQLRSEVAAPDLLNADGDLEGDSWPEMLVNPDSDLPDVVWSSGGDNREIMMSWHDGDAWQSAVNLSNSAGNDELPALAADEHGNRFVVWTRSRTSRDLVLFTALAGDDHSQTSVFELSERHDSARRAILGIDSIGDVYAVYEEAHNGNDPVMYLAIDRIEVDRDEDGYLSHSGESPIDIARSVTITTAAETGAALHPQVHVEGDHLWVDWIDSEGQLGWTELVDGAFTSTELVEIGEDGEDAARDEVRTQVLN